MNFNRLAPLLLPLAFAAGCGTTAGGSAASVACVDGACSPGFNCVNGYCVKPSTSDATVTADSADGASELFVSDCITAKCASQIGLCVGGCATWFACAQNCAATDAACQTTCAKKVAGDVQATSGVQSVLQCMTASESGCADVPDTSETDATADAPVDSATVDAPNLDAPNGVDASVGSDAGAADVCQPDTFCEGVPTGICTQVVTSEMTATTCNLTSWTPCPTGSGCYYAPALSQTFCNPHGSLGEGVKCDPCKVSDCGSAGDGHPLICDIIDKVCRRTCTPKSVGQCPSGQTCYQLTDQDSKAYPATGGVCAP